MLRKVATDVFFFVIVMAIVWGVAYFTNNEILASSTEEVILIGTPVSIVGSLIHYYFQKKYK